MRSTFALLVIDMQRDFVEEGALLEVKGIRKHLRAFGKFIEECRSAGTMVIYTRHTFSPQENPVEARLFPELSNKGLRKGSDGWQVIPDLEPKGSDTFIDKKRYDAFFRTPLLGTLHDRGITNVIITGTMTNICCESTARTAMAHDFGVLFCSDLTFCADPAIQRSTLNTMASHFGNVLTSDEILRILTANTPSDVQAHE